MSELFFKKIFSVFGLWKDRDVSIGQIRAKAWRRS
jgi:hypothetical protein